jgi:hypothetical protein
LASDRGDPAGNPQELILRGYTYTRGLANVTINYDAGYCVSDEAYTVSSTSYVIQIPPIYGTWAQDDGVTYANGTAMTAVRSAPAVGQYMITQLLDGSVSYNFNAADSGAAVLISYSYTPLALEQACMEWVAERYRYKDRIGQTSLSMGGTETGAYSLKGMPDFVKEAITSFIKAVPI